MLSGTLIRALVGISAVFGLAEFACADIFVYQLPDGARIVTDHPLVNRDYKLVRQSRTSKGAGTLVSSRSIQYAVTDPNAYDRLIRRMAGRHKVDAALVKAVMHVESAFNPHAVSHKGAQGLMQVMPETGQRYGAEDLFDPVQNVEAAVLYLKDLQKMFKNNTRLVLAAYNAGENAVLRYRGIPPYNETRNYVRKVLGMHRQYAATIVPVTRAVANAPAVPAQAVTPAAVAESVPAAIIPVAAIEPSASTPPEKNL